MSDQKSDATGGTPAAASPLSDEHRRQLADAGQRIKAMRGVLRLSAFSAWSGAILCVLSAAFLAFDRTAVGALLTVGLGAYAACGFRGHALVRRLDPRGARLLMINELGLLCLIAVYCGWQIDATIHSESIAEAESSLRDLIDFQAAFGMSFEQFVRMLTWTIYGSVIVVSAIIQGLAAAYYHRRSVTLIGYLLQTPQWIIDLQRGRTFE